MHRRDQIDARLAKHFAWSFAPPADAAKLTDERLRAAEAEAVAQPAPPQGPPTVSEEQAAANEQFRAKSQAGGRALAALVTETWAIADEEARLRAVKKLLSRAERLGIELLGLSECPLEAVRLLRLFVQYGAKATARQRERIATVTRFVPLDHPEAAELMVEIARAGDRAMIDAIFTEEDWQPEVGEVEALVARLADIVDDGPTHASRLAAIELVGYFEPRDAAFPALRRALRLPSFAARARALHALATGFLNGVEADDLVQVLRDLVAHAPPDSLTEEEHEINEQIFGEAVFAALENVHPEAAAELLLDWIDAEHETLYLDAGWATEALAVAFADTSAAMVDHWLKCAHAHDRMKAMGALKRLPAALVEPRLRVLVDDPSPSLREWARRLWLERFDRACPPASEGILGAALLKAPPSDRFAPRLAVIQGRVAEARHAMARALLAEAPAPGSLASPASTAEREALVLLLQLVADDAESHEPLMPSKDGGWARTVAERFGAVGVEGLCALAARFPEPESFGWMRRLGDLLEAGVIAREHAGPLRDLAARHVTSDDSGQIDDALRVLSIVGAPPELLERVLAVALDDDLGSWEARKLIVAWPGRAVDARALGSPELDTRLVREMALALAERDWTRLQHASWMALGRNAPAARVVAQRVLEVVEDEEDAADAAIECARGLQQAGVLGDEWALAALARPESPLFSVVARSWPRSPAVRAALEAALSSTAREGVAAAEAAVGLLHSTPSLSPRDRRLPGVLAAALPPWRAELVHAMVMHGAPLAVVAKHLEELLTSPEPNVTQPLSGIAIWLKSPRARTLLRAVLPRVVDAELRAEIEEELGAQPAPYWVEG